MLEFTGSQPHSTCTQCLHLILSKTLGLPWQGFEGDMKGLWSSGDDMCGLI